MLIFGVPLFIFSILHGEESGTEEREAAEAKGSTLTEKTEHEKQKGSQS